MLRDVLDELHTVESRVCDGQLVGERLSDVEDRARLVRGVERLRASVCSTEHAGDAGRSPGALLRQLSLTRAPCSASPADLAPSHGRLATMRPGYRQGATHANALHPHQPDRRP